MIFLYGAPASGKTTLGRKLAKSLGADFVDLDSRIVERAGRDIPRIFAESGEGVFRETESAALASVVESASPSAVVSLGGGTLLRDANRAMCENAGSVICLETPSAEELERRIGRAAGSRPLGDKARERAAHYASFPCRIAASFDAGDGAMASLAVVGEGIAKALAPAAHVVADSNVAKLYPGFSPMATIPSGEEHKTIGTVVSLWSAFAKAGLGRGDVVTALGGGVTGDLTGFAAATWMRGIAWINIPTTLLSMVDASTGGKTGCDLDEGKNLAGAFHAPKLVVIDTDFLETLPPEILSDGKAEMIKHATIGSCPVAGAGIPAASEIAANLAVKVGIVKEDPYETRGRRMLLNAGHTVGHAVETASNYKFSHGRAVAIGCVEEARLAVKFGLAKEAWPDELAAAFKAAGLDTKLPDGMSLESLVPLMKGDKKKTSGDTVAFALPCGWGDARAVKVDLSKGMRPC